jgi:hypothetical protein
MIPSGWSHPCVDGETLILTENYRTFSHCSDYLRLEIWEKIFPEKCWKDIGEF